jgi:hypothetical protein
MGKSLCRTAATKTPWGGGEIGVSAPLERLTPNCSSPGEQQSREASQNAKIAFHFQSFLS